MKKYLVCFLAMGLFFTSCNNNDDSLDPGEQPDPDEQANVVVQDFMWKAMNFWYFWQADVPNLSDTKFSTDAEYTTFLESEEDPAVFFDEKLSFTEDRFSFYNSDYKILTQRSSGISTTNGLEFGLVRFGDSDDVFGFVRYILPNSDASTKDIKRGDIFTGVNGQTLFSDRNNPSNNNLDLLFDDAATYTLNMATLENNTITPSDREVELTKQENFAENPVFIDKVFEIQGETIGYLMYNGFTNEYDEDLNAAFGRFVDGGVTNLVLDLRYNGGGSVNSSRLLASMIYGTNTSDLYIKQRWNSKVQAQLSQEQLEDYFAETTGAGSAINTLNLSKVYVLATNSSASASELVMNGLAPYMDVVHIGETTRGKNEFSIPMVDDRENTYIYNRDREANINSENSWAIQPLVGRNENADGFFEYTAGLSPDIEIDETLENLGVLGDADERMLARAISLITGSTNRFDFTAQMPIETFEDSKMMSPVKNKAILDKPLLVNFE